MKSNHKNLTPFQWQVLQAAMTIPFGETRSYQWVARKIGRPKAVRAVGQALRRNPYPLIIPCHRVICSDGSPGGYAGKFDRKKARILELERNIKKSIMGAVHKNRNTNPGIRNKHIKVHPKEGPWNCVNFLK